MQFTDSHNHLQDYKTKNTQQIITDLRHNNFFGIICVSSQIEDFSKVAEFYNKAPDIITPAFGIHPWHHNTAPSDWLTTTATYLKKYQHAIIGECGIDRIKGGNLARQIAFFRAHIQLSTELHRPLNIHLVHGEDIFAQFLKEIKENFMLHSFSGSLQFLQQVIRHGAYISVNQKLLAKPSAADIITNIPLSQILVESDAPYQSDYLDIPSLIAKLATVINISPEQLTSQIKQNFQKFTKKSP